MQTTERQMGAALSIPEPHEIPEDQRLQVFGGQPSLEAIAEAIWSGRIRRIVAAVGAGISVSAGIPDFRSPGIGLYDNLQKYELPTPESVFTMEYFLERPEPFCTLVREILPGRYRPTPAHRLLSILEAKGLLLRVFTQNIDGLERLAGLPEERLVEAHGSFGDAHCAGCHRRHDLRTWRVAIQSGQVPMCDACLDVPPPATPPTDEKVSELQQAAEALEAEKNAVWAAGGDWNKLTEIGLKRAGVDKELKEAQKAIAEYPEALASWEAAPKTYVCGTPVKPDIVFFGEPLPPRFNHFASLDGARADLLLVMGTSLSVMPFAGILGRVGPLCLRLLFNKDPVGLHDQPDPPMFFGNIGYRFNEADNYRDVFVGGDIDASVRKLCDLLGWGAQLNKPLLLASDPDEAFEVFEKGQECREDFTEAHRAQCLELMTAVDANTDGRVNREELSAARAALDAAAGVDFFPEFDSFVENAKDFEQEGLDQQAFLAGARRLFDILGPRQFQELLGQQLMALGRSSVKPSGASAAAARRSDSVGSRGSRGSRAGSAAPAAGSRRQGSRSRAAAATSGGAQRASSRGGAAGRSGSASRGARRP